MKLYFFTENPSPRNSVMHFANPADEPADAIASFELQEGQSTLSIRYKLENGALVDAYPGKTDDQVVDEIRQAAEAEAAAKAAQLAAANA